MKQKTQKGKSEAFKTLLAAAIMVGTVTGAFYGITQAAATAENNKVTALPTVYPTSVSTPATPEQAQALEGYVKPAYTVVDSDQEYYWGVKPTANDISRDEAAEIGVQCLVSAFGVDLNGKEIEMSYNRSDMGTRATWHGSCWYNGKQPNELHTASYDFIVDAISGELLLVYHNRILSTNATPGFDMMLLQNNLEDNNALAEEIALKSGAIRNAVETVEYGGQKHRSYPYDTDIWFDLTGVDGERARLTFSRHDKELLGIAFDAGVRRMEEAVSRMEQYLAANPRTRTGGSSQMAFGNIPWHVN